MEKNNKDLNIIEHILQYCDEIENTIYRFGKNYDVFKRDTVYQNACALCILQIGELAGHVSEAFKSLYQEIPWKNIRGMRNIVAHAYGNLSLSLTWETINEDIPALKTQCEEILGER